MRKLLLASNNPGKHKEIRALLDNLGESLVTPQDIGLQINVIEDGSTYHENAARKALAFAQETNMITLADDSGLEVDVLDGAPGLYSARFSPKPGAEDADRQVYMLDRLQGHPRPWRAQFRCVVAIAAPGQAVYYSEGSCIGEIIPTERGEGGFGYDPIFLLPELGHTMAELDMSTKNQLSHRAQAVIAARTHILDLLKK